MQTTRTPEPIEKFLKDAESYISNKVEGARWLHKQLNSDTHSSNAELSRSSELYSPLLDMLHYQAAKAISSLEQAYRHNPFLLTDERRARLEDYRRLRCLIQL